MHSLLSKGTNTSSKKRNPPTKVTTVKMFNKSWNQKYNTKEGYNDLLTKNPKLALEWNYEKNGDLKPNNFLGSALISAGFFFSAASV